MSTISLDQQERGVSTKLKRQLSHEEKGLTQQNRATHDFQETFEKNSVLRIGEQKIHAKNQRILIHNTMVPMTTFATLHLTDDIFHQAISQK